MMALSGRAVPTAMALVYPIDGIDGGLQNDRAGLELIDYSIGGSGVRPFAEEKGPQRAHNDRSDDGTNWSQHQMSLSPQLSSQELQKNQRKPPYKPPSDEVIRRYISAPIPTIVGRRGFSHETYRRWGLGNDTIERRWVFPICDVDGDVQGMTARLYWSKDYCFRCGTSLLAKEGGKHRRCLGCAQNYSKYLHTPGMPRSRMLFGAHMYEEGTPIVIVEGVTDALRLWEYGARSPMAILGSFPSMDQLRIAASLSDEIYAMGDGDMAGQKMNDDVVRMLSQIGVKAKKVPLDGADPGDLSREAIKSLLQIDKRHEMA
jgi:5S rRNA maturation endonuclease (ribonuclease M5)